MIIAVTEFGRILAYSASIGKIKLNVDPSKELTNYLGEQLTGNKNNLPREVENNYISSPIKLNKFCIGHACKK